MIGLLLVNQIEDYHEDKQMNVLTSTVRWGLKKASLVALIFTAVMSVVLLIVFSMLAKTPYAFVGVALMLVAYAATLRYHFKLFRAATSWEVTHTSGNRSTSTAAGRSGSIVVLCSRAAVGGGRDEFNLAGQAVIAVESQ